MLIYPLGADMCFWDDLGAHSGRAARRDLRGAPPTEVRSSHRIDALFPTPLHAGQARRTADLGVARRPRGRRPFHPLSAGPRFAATVTAFLARQGLPGARWAWRLEKGNVNLSKD
jgi:hypothetical protein